MGLMIQDHVMIINKIIPKKRIYRFVIFPVVDYALPLQRLHHCLNLSICCLFSLFSRLFPISKSTAPAAPSKSFVSGLAPIGTAPGFVVIAAICEDSASKLHELNIAMMTIPINE